MKLIGREKELNQVRACFQAKRNVLLEGPVGVGKTQLAIAVTQELKLPIYRIDGDGRYSEQKLSGWFDPPSVIKKGFVSEAFMAGPLVEAMQKGGVLFINELNRLPEGVQNVLLPAIDEGMIAVPRLGEIRAVPGFLVVATQNPKEFVATSHLSEAILDRFELIVLDYQTEEEELEIVNDRLKKNADKKTDVKLLALAGVKLVRLTRNHPRIRRGASIRAALSIAEITNALLITGAKLQEALLSAALLALPTRIEMERDADSEKSFRSEMDALIREWVSAVLTQLQLTDIEKKK